MQHYPMVPACDGKAPVVNKLMLHVSYGLATGGDPTLHIDLCSSYAYGRAAASASLEIWDYVLWMFRFLQPSFNTDM